MAYSDSFGKMKTASERVVRILFQDRFRTPYVFSFFLILFLVAYMTVEKVSSLDDHFFHIRFAATLLEKGWPALSDFRSIYYSKMGIGHEYLVYYNFLFYLILLPFALLKPLVLGIKLYGIIAMAASFAAVYAFLKNVSARLPFLWTLIFAAVLLQSGWLVRLSLARPFTLAPVFLVAMLYAVHRRKYVLSAVIPFLYFFWHTATFMFPMCLAVGYVVSEQFYGKRTDWKMIILPFLGTVAAVVSAFTISPGVVGYLRDVIFPVFFDTALTKRSGIAEGNEVYGRDFFAILKSFYAFLSALFVLGAYEIALYVRAKRGIESVEERPDPGIRPLRLTLFLASLVFLVGSTLSGRFLDYFVYFCILYVAIVATDAMRFVDVRGTFRRAAAVGLAIVSSYLFVSLVFDFSTGIAGTQSYETSEGPAEWLNGNVPEGAVVFNSSWSSFPTLYYFTGDRFRYVTGLEPRFLYDLDPRLYWSWRHIGDDGTACPQEVCSDRSDLRAAYFNGGDAGKTEWYRMEGDRVADLIGTGFGSDIVVASLGQRNFLDLMDRSDRFRRTFFDPENSSYAVYRVVPDAGE
ncbi:MAG TPA: hypothetical protein VN420_03020 [Candidatus Fimivivens sp.]|nr:hypothetical protein [Candidatus Fimivivens sp.]